MRSYLVIPAGTPVLRVDASTPHFAASKSQRGKAEHLDSPRLLVFPETSLVEPNGHTAPTPIPGQLEFDAGGQVEAP